MEDQEMSLYSGNLEEQDMDLRKGPWTDEEDAILVNYVSLHGEARWNNIARSSGLRRTGKSCRLRWLNYLRPDVRRGNITLQEQLMILELHSRWGNRWSKIAQFLPGRTDNEIKNYWRTRVQKQAKQLRCDVNSKLFKDTLRYVWMPRLAEQIKSQQPPPPPTPQTDNTIPNPNPVQTDHHHQHLGLDQFEPNRFVQETGTSSNSSPDTRASTVSDQTGQPNRVDGSVYESGFKLDVPGLDGWEDWVCGGGGGDSLDSLWNEESFWVFQEQIMQ